MATIDKTRVLEPDQSAPIGWDGQTLAQMLDHSESVFERDRPLPRPRATSR